MELVEAWIVDFIICIARQVVLYRLKLSVVESVIHNEQDKIRRSPRQRALFGGRDEELCWREHLSLGGAVAGSRPTLGWVQAAVIRS